MPIILEMPALSPSMQQGNLVSWIKKEGDAIEVGDVIAEIDTDKATMEVESLYTGVLEKILIPAGTPEVAIKTPIAIVRQKGDSDQHIQDAIDNLEKTKSVAQAEVSEIKQTEKKEENREILEKDKMGIKASPLAKKIANLYDIDISNIKGTGPGNRIVRADVEKSKASKTEDGQQEYTDTEPTQLRKIIASKLTKAKQEIPHFYIKAAIDMTESLKIRDEINRSGWLESKILIDAIIAKATAQAMDEHPEINVSWIDGKIRRYKNIDISIAVAVEGGIFTPIIKQANLKNIQQISNEIRELSKKAREGRLRQDEYTGGGITISNLGMYEIEEFYSIINAPQASILSIGPASPTPVAQEDNTISIKQIMRVGYAVDHRAIDGADAAKFVTTIKQNLTNR